MKDDFLLKNIHERASYILANKLPPELAFHNLEHTQNVLKGARVIGSAEGLEESEMVVLEMAAVLHDVGYINTLENHEDESIKIAKEAMKELEASDNLIKEVCQCIAATRKGYVPQNKLEEVIKDADAFHLSTPNYFDNLYALRKEWEATQNKVYSDLEWYKLNISYLTEHTYCTHFGQEYLQPKKEAIIENLNAKLGQLEKTFDKGMAEMGMTKDDLKKYKKKLLKAEGRPERGIETMFRLTSKNHISLSGIADSKANIIISVNSIIISVLIGTLMQKLDNNLHLIPPTVFLSVVNVTSIVFAVLSVRPNISKGTFTEDDIRTGKTNLLFFGNFHAMKRDDYHWGMNRLMENGNFLYSNLIDDIYFLGVVLAKKYKYLRRSYTIFMVGITISLALFIISNFFAL
ncbi:MAG: Pycsar system effector family protein [Bacteroidota bacterium]